MKLLVDVNFDATRADMLRAQGVEAIHWSAVGDSDDLDAEILAWAGSHGYAVVTQDLGVASVLARTDAAGPSVILLRHADDLNPLLIAWIASSARSHERELDDGCILVLDARTHRVRVRRLPTR